VTTPRVSVICIFFNAERFLREAVDSVLAQEFDAFEVLLVDDGSSDGSTAIALDYARRHPDRVRYLEHEGHTNRGMSAARNLGMANAAGEYIAFIDSDDHWRPDKLAAQAAILDVDPELGMVCGTVNYWSSWDGGTDRLVATGRLGDAVLRSPETSLRLYPLGAADAPCPSDVMFRRSLARTVGGFEEHFTHARQMYEDQGFFAKMYLTAPVHFSSQVWLDYRLHGESCVATVVRDGRYDEVRRYFLEWFADYIRPRAVPGKEALQRAVRKARFRLNHPRLARVAPRLRRLIGAAASGT
jgi:glycosyltransferase involved in cell wall biosynthesis